MSQGNTIHEAVMPYVRSGGITHYYAACGTLSQGVLQRSSHLPGGRCFFDLSSLTKALVTTPLMLRLAEGRPLAEVEVPFAGERFSAVALLQHEAGLPFWRNLWVCLLHKPGDSRQTASARLERFVQERPRGTRDSAYLYSDLGHMILSRWIEDKTQQSLDLYYRDFLETQLGVNPALLFFAPTQTQKEQSIISAYCPIRRRWLRGEVHDENASALGGTSGHAGLFGAGDGVESFLLRFLSSAEGRKFLAAQLPPYEVARRSFLGWQVGMGLEPSLSSSSWILGHQGFTGTLFWWEPARGHFGVFLTNRTVGARLVPWIQGLRRQVFSLQQNLLSRGEICR